MSNILFRSCFSLIFQEQAIMYRVAQKKDSSFVQFTAKSKGDITLKQYAFYLPGEPGRIEAGGGREAGGDGAGCGSHVRAGGGR